MDPDKEEADELVWDSEDPFPERVDEEEEEEEEGEKEGREREDETLTLPVKAGGCRSRRNCEPFSRNGCPII